MLTFDVLGTKRTCTPDAVVIAGFTGRDQTVVEAHLKELEALGIPTPSAVPTFYGIPTDLLGQDGVIATVHEETSGEVEVVIVADNDDVYLALGSDHTDRSAEAFDIGISKGLCSKPMSTRAWPFDLVADGLDDMVIRSWIFEGGEEVPYQEGHLSEVLPLPEMLGQVPFQTRPHTFVLFTGTIPVIGGIRGSKSFRAELFDPHSRRSLTLAYQIDVQGGLVRPHRPQR